MINGNFSAAVQGILCPADVQPRPWIKYVALSTNWFLNAPSRQYRKMMSHYGGYLADWLNTELLCRSGRWIRHYKVIYNGYYKQTYLKYLSEIRAQGGRVNESKDLSEDSIGDIMEIASFMMLAKRDFSALWSHIEFQRYVEDSTDNKMPTFYWNKCRQWTRT